MEKRSGCVRHPDIKVMVMIWITHRRQPIVALSFYSNQVAKMIIHSRIIMSREESLLYNGLHNEACLANAKA